METENTEKTYYTIQEASDLLHITRQTIYNHMAALDTWPARINRSVKVYLSSEQLQEIRFYDSMNRYDRYIYRSQKKELAETA